MAIDHKATYAVVNGIHIEIGDFVVVGRDPSDDRAERIWRIAGIHFDADGCRVNVVTDSRFTKTIAILPIVILETLLESEVELDEQGRFRRAD